MPFHSWVLQIDGTRTDSQIKADVDAFLVSSGIDEFTIRSMTISRHARVSEKYELAISAAI